MNLSDTVRKLASNIAELTKLVMNIRATAGGGVTGGQNIGAGGVGVYHSIVANTMRFRTVNAASAQITVALDAGNNEVDIELGPHTHQAAGSGGQLDHGLALTGLADDDHTQYLLAAGTRALSANWDAGAAAGRMIQTGYLVAGGAVAAVEYLQSESRLALKETTAPGGGTANYGILYVKSADSVLYFMDDAGVEYDLLAGGGGGGAPVDAEYIVGVANGTLTNERVKPALYDNFDLDDYPAAPDAMDDEFEDEAIDVKWTKVNDPAGADALSETKFKGFIWVGLPEYTDIVVPFSSFVRLYQAPPAGNIVQTYIAKVAIGCDDLSGSPDVGEWTTAAIYIGDPTGNDAVMAEIQFNDSYNDALAARTQMTKWDNDVGGIPTLYNNLQLVQVTAFVWLKLEKITADVFTNSNTYNAYFSLNGILWYQTGQTTFTFSNMPVEIGLCFRRPKLQGGTPHGYGIADCFRRIV